MHKLGTALVVAVVLALAAGAWAVLEVRRSTATLRQLVRDDAATLNSMHELAMQGEAIARNARMILVTRELRFVDQRSRVQAAVSRKTATLSGQLTNDEQRRILRRATSLRNRSYLEMDRAIEIMRTGDAKSASLQVLERVEPLRAKLSDTLTELLEIKNAELNRRTAEYTRASDRTMLMTSAFGGTALLCAIILAFLLQRALQRGSTSEIRLRHIFKGAAVAIMEQDYSKVARALNQLKASGVTDLNDHLDKNPALLNELVGMVEIRGINPAMRSLVGLAQHEQMQSLKPVLSEHALAVFRDVLLRLWAGRRSYHGETALLSRSGRQVEALLTVSFPRDPQREPVVTTLTDISARKREERRSREALEESEARLRAVFDQCPVGISMTDVEGRILYLNPAAQAIMMPAGDDQIGRHALDLMAPESRERISQWRKDFLAGHTSLSDLTLELSTLTGDSRTLRVQANLLREGDEVRGIVSSLEDITEHLRLEAQLRQAQKMEAVGQLAGGVAHDFNNLLTVILNGASLLHANASKDQADLLEQVEAAAERAASLTAQLLAFGRKQVMRLRVVDLNELVTNHCRMLHRLVGEKIELSSKLDPSGAPAEVDPNLIELLLMNLVVNARDALPLGGRIVIALESIVADVDARASTGALKSRPGGALLHLSVHDNGTGIDAEHLPHVFEPFFTTKKVGKGTGLGLATVYGIVEQHRGRIEVETERGSGTTFHVYLPRSEATAATWTEPVGIAPDGQETLLLVEDEAAVRQMVATSLARCGYRVIEAANGDIALELWKAHANEVDLLVTDVVMPGSLSGHDLAVRLRTERPELKVLYMSGYATHDLSGEPWSILVQKPFQLATLAQVLRARLDEKEPRMRPKRFANELPAQPRASLG